MTIDIPKNLKPFVDILGEDGAMEFLLTFGGSFVYLSERPKDSEMSGMIGLEAAAALAARLGPGPYRIPLAKAWLALQFKARGLSINLIARRLRVSDVTVRRYLQDGSAQLQLL